MLLKIVLCILIRLKIDLQNIKMYTLFKIILIMLSVCYSFTYGGTRDPNVLDEKYVLYGDQYTHVVPIFGKSITGKSFTASAVIIDDYHIITAAHVVNKANECFVLVNNKKFFLSKIIQHHDFNMSKYGIADIAIGFSKDSFGLNFYPKLYSGRDEKNKLCSMSGYGLTGTFVTGAKVKDGKKRAGSNFVDSIHNDILICSPSKKGEKNYTALEFLTAKGDSGGGLYIDSKLAGITSCVIGSNKVPMSTYGDKSGHTRISTFIDWIEDIQQKNLLDTIDSNSTIR